MVALFVALMFVSLVLTDLGIEKWRMWKTARSAQARSIAAMAMAQGFETLCEVPEGVQLAPQHTWLRPNPSGGLEIGADALIGRAVGALSQIILPKVGDQVTAGQPLFRLERDGCAVTIPSALTGRVMAVNSRLVKEPGLLSSDPYGSGWVCYVSPTRLEDTAPRVRFGEQATMWLQSEFMRFGEFIFGQVAPDLVVGLTSQDGGLPTVGCLAELGPKAWSAFQTRFLH